MITVLILSCLDEFFVINICTINEQRNCYKKKDRTGYEVRDIIKLSRYKGSAWKEMHPNMQQALRGERQVSARYVPQILREEQKENCATITVFFWPFGREGGGAILA
jgi:hypothetical protein